MSPIGNVIVTDENRKRGVFDVPIFRTVTDRAGRKYWLVGRVLVIAQTPAPREGGVRYDKTPEDE